MTLTVTKVERLSATEGTDFHIDAPQAGTTARRFLDVTGWAFDRAHPLSAVELVQSDVRIATATFDVPRPDVTTSYSEAPAVSGFSFTLATDSVDHDFRLIVRARRADGSSEDLARIAGAKATEGSFAPRFDPLLITTMGRTGSTWLMRLFAAHPELVAYRKYPYEIRPALYWMHALRVLTRPPAPGEFPDGTDPIVPAGHAFLGHNPFFDWPLFEHRAIRDWFEDDYVDLARAFCLRSIDELYERIAVAQKQPQARLYVEKFYIAKLSQLALSLYPGGREIVLVRDPRDVAASVFAFDEKRGIRAFGREHMNDDEFITALGEWTDTLARHAKDRADRALVVRYEDLVADPRASLRSILAHVGVDAAPTTINDMIAAANEPSVAIDHHRTTATAAESVGRWRSDLSPATRERCNALYGNSLKFFGYDPA